MKGKAIMKSIDELIREAMTNFMGSNAGLTPTLLLLGCVMEMKLRDHIESQLDAFAKEAIKVRVYRGMEIRIIMEDALHVSAGRTSLPFTELGERTILIPLVLKAGDCGGCPFLDAESRLYCSRFDEELEKGEIKGDGKSYKVLPLPECENSTPETFLYYNTQGRGEG